MSSLSKNYSGRVAVVLAVVALFCTTAIVAAAQDQTPKWELYGGYSLLYPNADVNGLLPGAILPLNSKLETNPKGAGGTITYNFTRWFGMSIDASTHWGRGENTFVTRIDDTRFTNFSIGP